METFGLPGNVWTQKRSVTQCETCLSQKLLAFVIIVQVQLLISSIFYHTSLLIIIVLSSTSFLNDRLFLGNGMRSPQSNYLGIFLRFKRSFAHNYVRRSFSA